MSSWSVTTEDTPGKEHGQANHADRGVADVSCGGIRGRGLTAPRPSLFQLLNLQRITSPR